MGKIRSNSRLKIINAIKAAGEKGITGRNIKEQTGVAKFYTYLKVNDMIAEEKVGCDTIYYWVGKNE